MLFFGDLFTAEVATVGLNPSYQEYLSPGGALLVGPNQRFATLASLRAEDRQSLSDAQADNAIEWMRNYYGDGKPVYRWFGGLRRVITGLGVSFESGTAVHLDLVQEATDPTWSGLPDQERDALLRSDLPFLEWQIRAFPLRVIICTSKTVGNHVRKRLGIVVQESGTLARITWWTSEAEIDGRLVAFAGWNYPLARPTGLGSDGELMLGHLIAEKLKV